MATTTHRRMNGVNVEQLTGTIDAVRQAPELARFRSRALNEWLDGGRSRTAIGPFFGAGNEDASRTEAFTLEGDEPPVLLGKSEAANAVETVLHALASRLAVGFAYDADALRDRIEELCAHAQRTSPVLDMLRNTVPAEVELASA